MKTDGLFDLQVNGYAGVDFNDASITASALDEALEAMLEAGVTGCLPTMITAQADDLSERLRALDAAVNDSRLGPSMVPGYHLEGPFLNPLPGYSGCHPTDAMVDVDIALVDSLEAAVTRPVMLVTLAPERGEAIRAIRHFVDHGKTVAMAHSAAEFQQVRAAADAGMSMSTHLGNGLPAHLPKLENALLAQLAETRLKACLIADGHHMSAEALRALVSIKGKRNCILVTDAVLAASASAGRYRFAGMDVTLDAAGRVVQSEHPYLAGSALRLDHAVRNLNDWSVAEPQEAARMASKHARDAIAASLNYHGIHLNTGSLVWNDALEPSITSFGGITL